MRIRMVAAGNSGIQNLMCFPEISGDSGGLHPAPGFDGVSFQPQADLVFPKDEDDPPRQLGVDPAKRPKP